MSACPPEPAPPAVDSGNPTSPAGGEDLVPVPGADARWGAPLGDLLEQAVDLLRRTPPGLNPRRGVLAQLQNLEQRAEGRPAVHDLARAVRLIKALRAYFSLADPADPHGNAGRIRLYTSADRSRAFMAVTPPRGDGNMPTINMVAGLLDRVRIVQGIDHDAIERTLDMVRAEHDVCWCVPVACGRPADNGSGGHLTFRVPVLDKDQLRRNPPSLTEALDGLGKPLEEDDIIGLLSGLTPGRPGLDVFGEVIQPSAPVFELGDDLHCSPEGVLTAGASGYLVRNGARLDLMPFYFLVPQAGVAGAHRRIDFPGAVAVSGDLVGPLEIDCEDLFVAGNCEQTVVQARGDVFIGGGVVGRNQTRLEADGEIHASFISEAEVSALGNIICGNAIVNSRLVSAGHISVLADKGMISGGNLAALQFIRAANIGSEFGLFTETSVGHDFLTTPRLAELSRRITLHEHNLGRIQELKSQLSRWRKRVEDLPPDKQEIMINVLRKERHSQMELKSLARRRERLGRAINEFVDASVRVLDSLYPPTRVQICDAIRDIREKLNGVTLKYHGQHGVIDATLPPAPPARHAANGEMT